jgi:hypothetical protein
MIAENFYQPADRLYLYLPYFDGKVLTLNGLTYLEVFRLYLSHNIVNKDAAERSTLTADKPSVQQVTVYIYSALLGLRDYRVAICTGSSDD